MDADVGKIAHARTLLPGHEGNLLAGDLFDADGLWPPGHRYALALLMPGRLLEVDDERAEGLRRRLRAHVQRLLVYRYPGYDSPHADLAGLASVAGIRLLDPADADGPALATVV